MVFSERRACTQAPRIHPRHALRLKGRIVQVGEFGRKEPELQQACASPVPRYAPPCRDTARSKVDVTHLLRLIPARLAAENMALCSDSSARTTNCSQNDLFGTHPR